MKKTMTKPFVLLCAILLAVSLSATGYAAGGVTYDGNARQFIFEPGSQYAPTDLFDGFKDVMPGDSLTQQITVKNDAANGVKINIYMRSLGAHEDSADFLSQLHMTVAVSEGSDMAYLFDAPADGTDGLTDWVLLGTLYSGGEVNLDLTLDVPITLDNAYRDAIGYLDWQFKVEAFAVSPDDPQPPKTGDDTHTALYLASASVSGAVVIFLAFRIRRRETKNG